MQSAHAQKNGPAASDRGDHLGELRIDRSTPPPRGTRMRRGWLIAAVLGLALIGVWYFAMRTDAVPVRIATVRAAAGHADSSVLDATGYVTARRLATVSAQVTGKVVEVLFEEGQTVEAGQVLARLDATTDEAQLALGQAQLGAARAALAETEAQLIEARRNLERLTELASRQLVSERELDAARAAADTLAARLDTGRENVTVAERALEVRREQVAQYEIRAPFAGVVIAKTAQPGEMISPISAGGGFTRTGIGTLVDMTSLEIEVDVNESYIQRVRQGQRVTATLDAYPDWKIPAEVIAIVPAADRQKATVRVRIGFLERDARVLPDMGVKVSFLDADDSGRTTPSDRNPLVPMSAVRERDGTSYVLVLAGDIVEERTVSIAASSGGDARVLDGLAPGERVVIDGPSDLASGARVVVER